MPRGRAISVPTPMGGVSTDAGVFPEEAIDAILAERIDIGRQSTGIVAVVSESAGSRLFAHARPDTADNRTLDGETVFEIGSITKVLSALLLAEMVGHGAVAFGDRVAKYLPTSVRIPEYNGKAITLIAGAACVRGKPCLAD